ncbi:DUF86 domain-containing protein [Paenibacillus phocaensis]|uniref:DUF86 domain-containing protein n=1 Tax=Paenibacillus phocaensis TaxID=1776378 RepID=UPI000839B871|nr:DUF86 domain-containing protein [Paenibacillus phocaensis]
MYYVNREQIERRLELVPELLQAFRESVQSASPLLGRYAEERALHLAIEIVTDVGSYLIDGFIMRDASSYEDIVDILLDEKVVDASLHATLIALVRLRKPLVQDYFAWERQEVAALREQLPEALQEFSANVLKYLDQEGV